MVIYNEDELESISFELKNLKSAIFLTDTVFGIVSKNKKDIYKIKNRKKNKKLILFIPNIGYIKNLKKKECDFLNKIWPSKITIIKSKNSYRIPNDNFILKLLSNTGPLYSSSANFSGSETVTSMQEAIINFSKFNNIFFINRTKKIDVHSKPSTIFNLDKEKIIRCGEVSEKEIIDILKNN